MPTVPVDYFRYFAVSPEIERWGVGLTAAGFTRVLPGALYPAGRHPPDHHFGWERGRVLDAMQIVLITEGRGLFETKTTGRRVIEAGTGFVILPNVWHRYRPDPARGWAESWIELRGGVPARLIAAGVISPATAVRKIDPAAGLDAALEAVHARARHAGAGFDPELAAAALGVLAAWDKARQVQPARSRILRAVTVAERHLTGHLSEPVSVAALARRLGVAYSHFRRAFKEHTGFSPWQYVLHLRLARARRLLAASDAALDEIATRLGFSSAFHLSTAFKRAYGQAPQHWRQKLARASSSAGARRGQS